MRSLTLFLCLFLASSVPCACTKPAPAAPPASFVTRMLLDNSKDSILECNTGVWTGRVTIAREIVVGYQNVTTTTTVGTASKTTLTLDGVLMTVERDGLCFGASTRVALAGETEVTVRRDGVYVKGQKQADLPASK